MFNKSFHLGGLLIINACALGSLAGGHNTKQTGHG